MDRPAYQRHPFQEEMRSLAHDILEMGTRAEVMVALSVECLSNLNTTQAREVLARDDVIDQQDLDIEARCLRILGLHQPLAGDLRAIGTALKMITDLERIGDLAVDIAKISMKIDKEFGDSTVIDLPRMGGVARQMLRTALQAFVDRDLEKVQVVATLEEQVDDLYRLLREQLFDHMREYPESVVADSWLLLAVHHLERIADHCVNIVERVSFMITGELREIVPDMPPRAAD
ncbi:MAG: phosphate signaling complex protein PhoU [Fimbriimonadaceae bacterium]|nr:phosphate signaling complex protein PhoU [Fimbriimonadaceae bacterium]